MSPMQVLGVLFAGLVVLFLALVVFPRRGERRPDLPGQRTVATFRWVAPAAEGSRAGDVLAARLASGLGALKWETSEVVAGQDRWGFAARSGRDDAYLELVPSADSQGGPWLLTVVSTGSGAPASSVVTRLVHQVLRDVVTGVTDLEWHRRERFFAGDSSSAASGPVDDDDGG